ncbi:MAG: hypothetical protein JWN93_678 [Hyphomicrobiales bacterium]|nr:hypothetical protein [Hyphomicrobiales bacterium]
MLEGASILICEDEPFIALDLALSVEEADGIVLGPAASVREALKLLEEGKIAGAILDVNLSDRDITPVAVWLLERNIPVIFQTAAGIPADLRERYPDARVMTKPILPGVVVHRMGKLLES